MFLLTTTERQALLAHAQEGFPNEVCGVILQEPAGRRVLIRGENVQDALHEQNPNLPPPPSAYTLAPQTRRRVRDCLRAGGRLLVVYHSHPNGLAEFSRADHRQALNSVGVPHYAGAVQVVVALGGLINQPQVVAVVWDPLARRYRRLDGWDPSPPSGGGG